MGDHGPDVPFGCPKDFGPLLGFRVFPDMRVHSCVSADPNHEGVHTCKCGATSEPPSTDRSTPVDELGTNT